MSNRSSLTHTRTVAHTYVIVEHSDSVMHVPDELIFFFIWKKYKIILNNCNK